MKGRREAVFLFAASLQAAETLLLCPCITSICRSFVTICLATNLFLGIFFLHPRACFLILPGSEKAGHVTEISGSDQKIRRNRNVMVVKWISEICGFAKVQHGRIYNDYQRRFSGC